MRGARLTFAQSWHSQGVALGQLLQVVRALKTVDGSVIQVPDGTTLQTVRATFPCIRGGLNFPQGSPENTTYRSMEPNIGNDGRPFASDLRLPVPLGDLAALSLDTGGTQQTGFVTLVLAYRGAPLEVDVPIVAFGSGSGEQVMTFRRGDPVRTLASRLAEDQLYYSQVVWQAMDSATIALLLAPYTYAGQPLAQVADPAPIGTSGNYLIFRMPGEARDLLDGTAQASGLGADPAWKEWVGKHADYDTKVEDFVPLPSGGVFAEAVLGRSNSAEKLDITRFWNWQDSPIPLQAPEIAPVQTGSRAQADNTTPSGFAAPIVAFNNPTPLPDPAGLSATLGALANGAMFRDMSGSSTTQALALAALTGAGQGATSAGAQASGYAAVAAQKEIEMAKIAAGVLTGGLAGGGGGTVSEQGARINEGRSLDKRAASRPSPTAADGSAGTAGAAGSTTHEALAAEGDSGKAMDLLSRITGASGQPAGAPATTANAAPPGGTVRLPPDDGPGSTPSSTSSSSSSPSSSDPAPTPRPTPTGSG